MSVNLLVGGELPEQDVQALLAGTSRACPLTVHRPGNRLGLGLGSVIRFTPTEPAYVRRWSRPPVTATVTVDTAVTAFIYAGPHVDATGKPVGAGCRFTGHGVIPNAAAWRVQLPDGTELAHPRGTGARDELGATFGSG